MSDIDAYLHRRRQMAALAVWRSLPEETSSAP